MTTASSPAQIIDGVALSQQLRADATERVMALKAGGITPGLAVILVGDNPASQVYVRNKVKGCKDIGMHSVLEQYPADLSEAELLARIEALNQDPAIHGILVQLPVPKHIDANKVIEAIAPAKDDPAMMAKVDPFFHQLVADAKAQGYGEYRTHLDYMDLVAKSYDFNGGALTKLNTRVKDALDPNGIISAGRYGVWPKHLREGRGA